MMNEKPRHLPPDKRPVAIVTGGARRVGNIVVRDLAGRGYRVVVHANRSLAEARQIAAELSAQGDPSIAIAAELRDPDSVTNLVAVVHEHFGRIDALVNCAAIWNRKPLEEITAQDVREHFEVNTLGTFLCCQQVGMVMTAQASGGAIVNVGDWAISRPYVDYAAYFPSKGAIPTLTRTFAVELARRNPRVRVNAVLPGPVLLPATMSERERNEAVASTLVRREGTPQHVAHAVAFLLENDFVTGVCLPVDGGRSIFAGEFEHG
jgi:pteridine reductase